MAIYAYEQNYGHVARLYPTEGRTWFRLKDGRTAMKPKSGYYFIPTTHDNYKALISLLYMAADSRYIIYARTKENLVDGYAEVIYLVVDW